MKERVLTTAITEADGAASLDLALSVAEDFELKPGEANAIAAEVGAAVATWCSAGAHAGIKKNEIDRMASAFQHDELEQALAI